jgi:hypothetical protein
MASIFTNIGQIEYGLAKIKAMESNWIFFFFFGFQGFDDVSMATVAI